MSIVSILLLVGLVGGAVWLVGRRNEPSDTAAHEGQATLGTLFRLGLTVALVFLTTAGVSGLLSRAFTSDSLVLTDSAALARNLAWVVIGGPLAVGLVLNLLKRIRAGAQRRDDAFFALGMWIVILVSMITALIGAGDIIDGMFRAGGWEEGGARLVAWLTLFAGTWWLFASDRGPTRLRSLTILSGSVVGLGVLAGAAGAVLGMAFGRIYDQATGRALAGDVDPLIQAGAWVGIGLVIWGWFWLLHGLRLPREGGWLTYVLLPGVFGGLVAAVSAISVVVFTGLDWWLGNPAPDAVDQFDTLPAAMAAAIIGGAVWAYHRAILRTSDDADNTEPGRIYRYLVTSAGLAAAAVGVGILVAAALQAPVSRVAGSNSGTLLGGITALIVGGPIWAISWRQIQHRRHRSPAIESSAPSRRIFLVAWAGLAALVATVSLIIVAFQVFEGILDQDTLGSIVEAISIPVGLLVASGSVAGYHTAVWRQDRPDIETHSGRRVRSIVLVAPDDGGRMAADLRTATHAKVTFWPRLDDDETSVTADEVADEIAGIEADRVIVVVDGAHPQVVPYRA